MSAPPPRIAVAMTCFNRREKTLRCLRSLFGQASLPVTLDVYLVDDGSTDGTSAAIAAEFPSVHIVAGTGSLFWGGGMYRAMSAAVERPYDFVLWLNDDVTLHPDALAELLAAHAQASAADSHPSVIVGAVTDPETGKISYAGFNRTNRWHPIHVRNVAPEPGRLVPCDAMNGNCVLIPRAVVGQIGLIDGELIHRYGDIDYGYRARRAGANVLIAPDPVGTCSPNPPPRKKDLSRHSLAERWRILTAPLGTPMRPMFRFMWRHGGVSGAIMGAWTALKLAGTAIRGS